MPATPMKLALPLIRVPTVTGAADLTHWPGQTPI
jgi:hypothetical protein